MRWECLMFYTDKCFDQRRCRKFRSLLICLFLSLFTLFLLLVSIHSVNVVSRLLFFSSHLSVISICLLSAVGGGTEPAFPISDAWGPATGQVQQEGVPEQLQRLGRWRPPGQTGQLFPSLRHHQQDWAGQPTEEPPPALAHSFVLRHKHTHTHTHKHLQEHTQQPAASTERLKWICSESCNQH